ncbi:MAG: hypothetical protein K6T37_04540 [Acidothermus cellulolyticus]|nr:hypothetical protein [Acidothermus cellulolyticus]
MPINACTLMYAYFALPKDSPNPSESFDFLGMLLLSPGLALFLFGVSPIPTEGTAAAAPVIVPGLIGLTLVVLFALRAFRPEHPLIDLRLFKNKQPTLSTAAMFIFAVAFFGATRTWRSSPTSTRILSVVARCTLRRSPRHGIDDDAAVHRRAADTRRPDNRARLNPDEHHAANRQFGRRCGHVGRAEERGQELVGRWTSDRLPTRPGLQRNRKWANHQGSRKT